MTLTLSVFSLIKGIYVVGFFYPVVMKNKVRIRVQISAVNKQHHPEKAATAFKKVAMLSKEKNKILTYEENTY